jgi:hypothetical protein
MVVAADTTVRPNCAHILGQSIVCREECASISVATEWLGGKKASTRYPGNAAAFPAILSGAEALRCILDYYNPMFCGDPVDGFIVRHLAEKAYSYDGLGPWCNSRLNLFHTDIIGS